MYLQKAVLLLFALHISFYGKSQQECDNIFTGVIRDNHNYPVSGAVILLLPDSTGLTSDELGNFEFKNICEGKYKALVQFLGFDNVEFNVFIKGKVSRSIVLQEQITQLNEVVIQHHDDTHTEHVTNYTELNERDLTKTAGKSFGESLKQVAGVSTIQTGPGIYKPVIHGVHSQRILILNHGLRQEGQQWGAEHAPEIDPFVAGNIVVIKDASAIKYGTNALGGVIVVNPPPLPENTILGGTLSSVLQNNGRSGTLSGMLEGGIGKRTSWGWRVQGTIKRTGDFETPNYFLTNTGIRESNFSVATGYHKNKSGLDIFFSRFQSTLGILKGTSTRTQGDLISAMVRTVPLYTSDFSYSISHPRQEVAHSLLKLNGHLNTAMGEWRWQYGFQNNHRKEFDFRIGSLSKIPAINLQLNTHSLDVEWETPHSDTRTFTIGINSTYQNNQNIYGTQRIPFIPNFTSLSTGLFAVTKLYLNTWTIDLGARYDYRNYSVKGFDFKNSYYSTSFQFNNVSATLGTTKRLGKGQSLNFNVSTSWRPPHVSELYSVGKHQSVASIEYGLLLNDSTNEVMDINEINFKTEQALKFVVSYGLGDEKLKLNVSPYFNYIFNYIFLRSRGITQTVRGVYPYFRYDQTNALFLGADIDLTWHPLKHVAVAPKVSLLRATEELNDDYFLFIPSSRFEVALRYERPVWGKFKNIYIESSTSYVARQNNGPRVITSRQIDEAVQIDGDPLLLNARNFDFMAPPPGYWLFNAAVGLSIKSRVVQYDFRLSSDNIFNNSYREYTNRFRYYADDLGRNIILSFKCIF